MYLQDPFTNWANFWCVSCTRVVLYVYQISSLYYFFFLVFKEKCHENFSDTFSKKFCWPEFSRYLNKTPFCNAQMSKVSWKKFTRKSNEPVFWKRDAIKKSPFCWYHENRMKTGHENCTQDSTQAVPNLLWKPFLSIYFSFPVIRIWIVRRKKRIIIRRKRRITITTSFRKLLTRDQHWFQGTICKQLPSLLYTFQAR